MVSIILLSPCTTEAEIFALVRDLTVMHRQHSMIKSMLIFQAVRYDQ